MEMPIYSYLLEYVVVYPCKIWYNNKTIVVSKQHWIALGKTLEKETNKKTQNVAFKFIQHM